MYHPWRELGRLAEWTIRFVTLPRGVRAECHWAACQILMDRRLTQVERRSALAHELEHVHRGPFPRHAKAKEEAAVNAAAARKLVDLHALGEALAWARHESEAADELWIDIPTLRARLTHLRPAELRYLRGRLAHHDVDEDHHGTHP